MLTEVVKEGNVNGSKTYTSPDMGLRSSRQIKLMNCDWPRGDGRECSQRRMGRRGNGAGKSTPCSPARRGEKRESLVEASITSQSTATSADVTRSCSVRQFCLRVFKDIGYFGWSLVVIIRHCLLENQLMSLMSAAAWLR